MLLWRPISKGQGYRQSWGAIRRRCFQPRWTRGTATTACDGSASARSLPIRVGLAQSLSHTSYQVTFRRAAPEYTASEKKRPAREVRNSTDKQRSQLKHQKVESLPPSSSSSSFSTPSSLSSHSNLFGSYSSTSTASTTSAALSSDFSGASQRLVPPQPRVGDGYVQTSEARTQASLWLLRGRCE